MKLEEKSAIEVEGHLTPSHTVNMKVTVRTNETAVKGDPEILSMWEKRKAARGALKFPLEAKAFMAVFKGVTLNSARGCLGKSVGVGSLRVHLAEFGGLCSSGHQMQGLTHM